jgi:protein-tyrosine kinase
MSKIEKALEKASEQRNGLQLVPVKNESRRTSSWTALVGRRVDDADSIDEMAKGDGEPLTAEELRRKGIIHLQQTNEPVVQVFRELRTKIIQQSGDQNAVILITSVSKGNGGSFIARNLAAAFAFDAAKTALLVDCNFRNPSVHALLADATLPGLADYFQNPDIGLSAVIQPVGISRMRVIAAGGSREIPAEYFASTKMRALVEALRDRYHDRFVILDAPPTSDIADIRILSELADYVLIVARHGRTTNAQIESSLQAMTQRKLLGIVFNDEPRIPWIR